jgi:hypothetical protein
LLLAALVCGASWQVYGAQDFASLHDTASLWLRTGEYRTGIGSNLNLPHTTLLLVPAGLLPLFPAWIGWQALNILCLAAVAWRLRGLLTTPTLLLLVITPAMLAQIVCGQIAGVVALLVDTAWRADRDRKATRAGVWLGCAIAMKPFLLPIAAWWITRREWRSTGAALATAAAISGVGLLLFGDAAYREWLSTLGQIDWYQLGANASLLGAVRRSGLPEGIQHPIWLVACFGIAVATALAMRRSRNIDRGWTLLLVASLLLSPLGWTYYELMMIGPLVSVARSTRWTTEACLLAWIPPAIVPSPFSIATVALLTIWVAVLENVRVEVNGHGDRHAHDLRGFGSARA